MQNMRIWVLSIIILCLIPATYALQIDNYGSPLLYNNLIAGGHNLSVSTVGYSVGQTFNITNGSGNESERILLHDITIILNSSIATVGTPRMTVYRMNNTHDVGSPIDSVLLEKIGYTEVRNIVSNASNRVNVTFIFNDLPLMLNQRYAFFISDPGTVSNYRIYVANSTSTSTYPGGFAIYKFAGSLFVQTVGGGDLSFFMNYSLANVTIPYINTQNIITNKNISITVNCSVLGSDALLYYGNSTSQILVANATNNVTYQTASSPGLYNYYGICTRSGYTSLSTKVYSYEYFPGGEYSSPMLRYDFEGNMTNLGIATGNCSLFTQDLYGVNYEYIHSHSGNFSRFYGIKWDHDATGNCSGLPGGDTDITMYGWYTFYSIPVQTTWDDTLMFVGDPNNANNYLKLSIGATSITVRLRLTDGADDLNDAYYNFTPGRKYFIAATYDRTNNIASVYVDGILIKSKQFVNGINLVHNTVSDGFAIGGQPNADTAFLDFYADSVYLYNSTFGSDLINITYNHRPNEYTTGIESNGYCRLINISFNGSQTFEVIINRSIMDPRKFNNIAFINSTDCTSISNINNVTYRNADWYVFTEQSRLNEYIIGVRPGWSSNAIVMIYNYTSSASIPQNCPNVYRFVDDFTRNTSSIGEVRTLCNNNITWILGGCNGVSGTGCRMSGGALNGMFVNEGGGSYGVEATIALVNTSLGAIYRGYSKYKVAGSTNYPDSTFIYSGFNTNTAYAGVGNNRSYFELTSGRRFTNLGQYPSPSLWFMTQVYSNATNISSTVGGYNFSIYPAVPSFTKVSVGHTYDGGATGTTRTYWDEVRAFTGVANNAIIGDEFKFAFANILSPNNGNVTPYMINITANCTEPGNISFYFGNITNQLLVQNGSLGIYAINVSVQSTYYYYAVCYIQKGNDTIASPPTPLRNWTYSMNFAPIASKFNGSTYGTSGQVDYRNVTGLILEIAPYGKISFNGVVDIGYLDLNTLVDINDNYAYVNSPNLNVSANITIRFNSSSFVQVYKDGELCDNTCRKINYNGNNVTLEVLHFSNYSVNGTNVSGNISVCADLNYNNIYYNLTTSVDNTTDYCFKVYANNVTFNGQYQNTSIGLYYGNNMNVLYTNLTKYPLVNGSASWGNNTALYVTHDSNISGNYTPYDGLPRFLQNIALYNASNGVVKIDNSTSTYKYPSCLVNNTLCNITMESYDPPGLYYVIYSDIYAGLTISTFSYDALFALIKLNTSTTLNLTPGIANVSSYAIGIRNTGNNPMTYIYVLSRDLVGFSNPSYILNASYFRAGKTLGSSNAMVNNASIAVPFALAPNTTDYMYLWVSTPTGQYMQIYQSPTPWTITVS